jgi:hypothetical protein
LTAFIAVVGDGSRVGSVAVDVALVGIFRLVLVVGVRVILRLRRAPLLPFGVLIDSPQMAHGARRVLHLVRVRRFVFVHGVDGVADETGVSARSTRRLGLAIGRRELVVVAARLVERHVPKEVWACYTNRPGLGPRRFGSGLDLLYK